MKYITRPHLQQRFGLPAAIASELISEHTRLALLRRWQPWACLVGMALIAATVRFGDWPAWPPRRALWVMVVSVWVWMPMAHWLACDAILQAVSIRREKLYSLARQEGQI